MSEVPFFATRMGRTFFEHAMPELVRQLERLNENLERARGTETEEVPAADTEADDGQPVQREGRH